MRNIQLAAALIPGLEPSRVRRDSMPVVSRVVRAVCGRSGPHAVADADVAVNRAEHGMGYGREWLVVRCHPAKSAGKSGIQRRLQG